MTEHILFLIKKYERFVSNLTWALNNRLSNDGIDIIKQRISDYNEVIQDLKKIKL